jgi:hypothetical protein
MRAFHAQLNSLGLMDDKANIIKQFTNERTSSARELTDQELYQLLQGLQVGAVKPPGDKMRKAIISMAHEMGWRKAGRIDMLAINTWCINKGKYHKKLNDHNMQELTELVTQFKIMYEKHLNTI